MNIPIPSRDRQKAAYSLKRAISGPHHAGFSLAEVVAALGIATFALMTIVGLLPTSINTTRDAVQCTEAAQVASAIACDLRSSAQGASAATTGTSAIYRIPLQSGTYPLFLDNVGNTTADATSARFRAQIVIALPPATTFTASSTIAPVSYAAILLTWPAAAPVANASGHLEIASSFTPSRL
ncbi:MAG: hypothetical protein WCH57_08230 [Verrucomicrobiota bacterium]